MLKFIEYVNLEHSAIQVTFIFLKIQGEMLVKKLFSEKR